MTLYVVWNFQEEKEVAMPTFPLQKFQGIQSHRQQTLVYIIVQWHWHEAM